VATALRAAPGGKEAKPSAAAAPLKAKRAQPRARAIRERAEAEGLALTPAENFAALPGHGIRGTLSGKAALGGSGTMMAEQGLLTAAARRDGEELAEQGNTPLFFARDGKLLGVIAVADVVKADSAEAIAELKELGLQTLMLTGDNRRTALAIARRTGLDAVISDVLPGDKEAVVRRLSESGKTAMVGDGINDAPALTRADLGVAIGAGADVALDAADVVLMKSSLKDVSAAIRLSRQVLRNIHENLFWAFFYNCIGIPIAAGVLIPLGVTLSPMIGAAAMSLSSFCVVTNALRLNLFDVRDRSKGRKKQSVPLPDFVSDYRDTAPAVPEQTLPAEPEIKEEIEMKKILTVDGMMCQNCVKHVKKALEGVDGVSAADVVLEGGTATVTLVKDVADEVLSAAVTEAGYTPLSVKAG
jgi:Cu2+-exporting ATPase